MDNVQLCLVIAIVLFALAGIMRLMGRAFDGALVAAGLAMLTLSFLVNP